MAARLTGVIVVAVIAATVIAGLVAGARRGDRDGSVTLIIHNGRALAGGNPPAFAEAVAISGNRVLEIGSSRDVRRLRRPRTVEIDARGATVLPGFHDAHVDLIDAGLSLAADDHGASGAGIPPDAPGAPMDERRRAVLAAIVEAHRAGVTSVLHAAHSIDDLELLDAMRHDGELRLRVRVAFSPDTPPDDMDPIRLDAVLASIVDAHRDADAIATVDQPGRGRITPGMLADLVVLDRDIFEDADDDLLEASVRFTIFDGAIVFNRRAASTD